VRGARKAAGGARLTEKIFRIIYQLAHRENGRQKGVRSSFGMSKKEMRGHDWSLQGDTRGR
jgi:hypothetical protein